MSDLSLQRLTIAYGRRAPKGAAAVNDLDLEVPAGQLVSLLGPSGCGKTTTMRAVAGLLAPQAGRIVLGGEDITRTPAHQRVGLGLALSPEGRGVFPDQTVRDNLLLGAYARRQPPEATAAALAREFARFPRLHERQHQAAGTLSGGEQQMLAIARALMSEPRLLLLDEPSLGLAPLIIVEIFRAIRALRDAGITILLVEQMANQALAVADRAYVLETGRITLQGTGRELANDPQVRAAYLGAH